ncbi:hypothetical protein FISHEDRAFT_47536, partial [Fistulina hepatica ATCC 64428]
PIASTGYIAHQPPPPPKEEYSLEDLVSPDSPHGFRLQKWDGQVPMPIVNSEGHVVIVLAGCLNDPNWDSIHIAAADELEKAWLEVPWPNKGRTMCKRGNFHALHSGIAFGGGQPRPMNAHHNDMMAVILQVLNQHWAIMHITIFTSTVFLAWAPHLYHLYLNCIEVLLLHHLDLVCNFASSICIWAAVTYNFGPCTVTWPHRDFQNLPYGWCCITALSCFDYCCGGHLILWDLKLIIKFPPGSTILIPSAIVKHSNTYITTNETQYLMTQYSAGGLFHWVKHGFQKESEFWEQLDEETTCREQLKQCAHWANGLDYFLSVNELSSL